MTSCEKCPLLQTAALQHHTPQEAATVATLKIGDSSFQKGVALIHEGQKDVAMMTLLRGWAFRFKTTRDGRRQILNFLLPGDLIGVQQNVTDAAAHGVEALTDVTVCQFATDALWRMHQKHAQLSFQVTWQTALEERLIDNNLLSVGQRSATDRVQRLLTGLFMRATNLGLASQHPSILFPLSQQHIADALGLSLIHVHRTLRALEKKGFHSIHDGRLQIHQIQTQKTPFASLEKPRPFI